MNKRSNWNALMGIQKRLQSIKMVFQFHSKSQSHQQGRWWARRLLEIEWLNGKIGVMGE